MNKDDIIIHYNLILGFFLNLERISEGKDESNEERLCGLITEDLF
jgi:hypothetical protein